MTDDDHGTTHSPPQPHRRANVPTGSTIPPTSIGWCSGSTWLCALLLVIDPFVHKHGPFKIEHIWGFYGIFGFVACVAVVLIAKQLRKVLMRPEDYYDR